MGGGAVKELVLVTGISGYIALHVAHSLLADGYRVRGTVRSMDKSEMVRQALKKAGANISQLSFVEADLENDINWEKAVDGCTYIQHIASPYPTEQPSDREALVPAARAGAQRVLAAGFAANVKRIVMTSSLVAMTGKPGKGPLMNVTEDDWTDPNWRALGAYSVSKTKAELSAWEYSRVQGFESKLTVINPGLVLGPPIGSTYGASLSLIEQLLKGELKQLPKVSLMIVDVRDLARMHVAAMVKHKAKGRRLIAVGESLWLSELADILSELSPKNVKKLPKGEVPNFVVKIASLFIDRLKPVLGDLGTFYTADNKYVQDITGIVSRPVRETLSDTVQYLSDAGKI